ncbi:MAG: VCBS repeat-containing protein [Thermodesulfovibrionales bacterium]|nr:VCBS repeat-containing protein [Thermodesulfovibrionales bacterium]
MRLEVVSSQESGVRSQKSKIKNRRFGFYSIFCILYSLFSILLIPPAYADDNPLNMMRDDVLLYFKPLKGRIKSISNEGAIADIGIKSDVKKGMRFTVFREGTPFLHPVTKEPIGLLEAVIGKAEVRDVGPDTSAIVILKGDVKESDRIRVSETGVRVLFYHRRNVDWSLADSYYRLLKETGRFELIDTALETDSDEEVLAEAKKLNADVVLVLSAKGAGGDILLGQRLFWVDNSVRFAESETKVAFALMKEFKFGEEFFGPQKVDTWLYVDLPFGVRLIASGDVDGDGKAEILLSTGKDVRFYMPGGEISKRYEIKGAAMDDHLWLDVMDINGDGRHEVMITVMKDDKIISRIYEMKNDKFSVLWEGNVFLRRIGSELVAQAYTAGEGYRGPVFTIIWKDGYKKGGNISLPNDVNIYDFVYINESDGRRLILAYDDAGYLSLYDGGKKIWQSKEDYGGFLTTFRKPAPTVMADMKGEWSVKDRLSLQNREVFVIKRVPLVGMAKGMGYSNSQVRSLWWTGVSMEERTVIENIPGTLLDYSLEGDRLILLDRPSFGIKLQNIFKGENPLGSVLYIYSLKGR